MLKSLQPWTSLGVPPQIPDVLHPPTKSSPPKLTTKSVTAYCRQKRGKFAYFIHTYATQ